jgi:hypothetical protein
LWRTGADSHGKPIVIETKLDENGDPVGSGTPVKVYNGDVEIAANSALFKKGLRIWVAVPGGQHSGDLICLMRYDVAKAYVLHSGTGGIPRRRMIDGKDGDYNPRGEGLRTTQEGTVRFRNAVKGNCEHQIRVNDK